MTVTLKLKPEVEAGLLHQAAANGMTLEAYVLSLIESAALLPLPNPSSAEERAAAFAAWSAAHPATPPLSDFAITRESMYDARQN